MKLYQLCGTDPKAGFSPYTWRVKLCLLHKGLAYDEEPIRFLEKDKISHAPVQTVPVLDDGDITVVDSFAIAEYLEATYPEPSLFGGPVAAAQARFFNSWIDQNLVMGIAGMMLKDIHDCLDSDNQAYFRETREARFGASLEDVVANRDEAVEAFRTSLAPLRLLAAKNKFLSGDAPYWLDYAVFGTFMWPHIVSDFQLLLEDDPLFGWRERMFDLFGGAGRSAKRAV